MRITLTILTIIIFHNVSLSQKDIYGVFCYGKNPTIELQLNTDNTYNYSFCFNSKVKVDSGIFYINNDTLTLVSKIITEPNIYFLIHNYKLDENIFEEDKLLIQTLIKDSIFDYFYLIHLDNNKHELFGYYLKQTKFYNNRIIEYKIQSINGLIIINHFFENGQIMSLKTFKKNKKTGNWYYFDKNAVIIKIEIYKKDKLIKTVPNRVDCLMH
jgi:hypothetical protein